MKRFLTLTTTLCLIAPLAHADAPATIDKLFPSRAPILVEKPGIARLPLSPDILGACHGDLADLRIVDGKGNEVAYVVDSGLDPAAPRRVEYSKDLVALLERTRRNLA